ncbi:MAG: hypothetical protein RL204_997 [Bacteroidota bacterium]|jgi:hypothetical protein
MTTIVQSQFFKFHGNIKLNDTDDLAPVREKRETLLDEIRDYLKKKSKEEGKPLITFTVFNQGSYPMGTGIQPLHDDDDYDIDVGLAFNISKNDYTPLQAKQWVFEALNKPPRKVEFKRPCIRVQYHEKGEVRFHIDFAIYSDSESNSDRRTYIAKGKPGIPKQEVFWEVSEPQRLKELINDRYSKAEDRDQFKRVIRYHKRWKDFHFTDTVNGIPTGISLTALAYRGFQPYTTGFTGDDIDDLKASLQFIKYIIGQFTWNDCIEVRLPVAPGNNLFERMSESQMKNFKNKLIELRDTLTKAQDEADPHAACQLLQDVYGSDFPVPPKESTGQSRKRPIASSSESA